MPTEVLSVRIRKELKEEAKKLNINIRKTVEKALEEEIKKTKKKRLKSLIEEALSLAEFTPQDWVKDIKEDRTTR